MKKLFFSLSLLLGTVSAVFGQRTFSSPPADSTARSNNATIIITESTVNNFSSSDEPQNLHTSVKINPLLVLAGDMPIYIEQKIAKRMSAEVGLGLTFDNIITDALDPDHYDPEVKRQNEMSYSFSGALRYYPSHIYPALEGYYFAPEVRYRNYKATAFDYNGQRFEVPQSRTFTDIKLTFGFVEYVEDHILVDIYGGIGVRNREYVNLVKPSNVFDPQTQTIEYYTTRNEKNKIPVFSLGFKIGFSF